MADTSKLMKNSKAQSTKPLADLEDSVNLQDLFNNLKMHKSKKLEETEKFNEEIKQLKEKAKDLSPKSKRDLMWHLEDSESSHDEDLSFPSTCLCLVCN